ncbi:MAG: hypothetical protein ABMB14_39540 [Myxococcota bacterium]
MWDFGRWTVIAGCGVAILALMGWWIGRTADGAIGAIQAVDQAPGTPVVLSLLTVIAIDGPEAYTVGHAALRIPVVGPTDALVVGSEVTVGGVVEPGRIRASWVEPAPSRPAKRRLGLAGLSVAALLAVGAVRIRPGGLAIRG